MPISLDDYQSFESLSSRQPRPPTTPEDDSWEITKGFSAGVDETFALLGGALPAALGSLVGADEFQADRMDYYREQMRLAAESRGSNTTLEEIDGFDDALNFGLYHIGNMIPSLIGGGAAGAAVKGAAKKIFLQRKFEQEAKEKLAKVARDLPSGLSQKEARRLQADYTAAAISKPLQRAAALGFGSYSVGSGIGESFARILEEEGVEAPMLAIGTGVMSGALDALAPIAAIKKVFPEGISDKVVQQVGKSLTSPNVVSKGSKVLFEAAKFGVGEGTTEAVQEILQNASQAAVYAEGGEDALNLWYERMTDSVSTSAYLNAAAAGAVGGSALGGASSLLTGYGAKNAQSRELLDTVDGETDADRLENLQNLPPLDMEVDDAGPMDSEVIEAEEAVGIPLPVEEAGYDNLPLVEVSSEKSSKPTKIKGLDEDREQAIFDGDMDFQEQLSKLTAARLKVKPIVEEQLPVAEFEEISFPALGQLVGKEVQYGKHHGFLRREGNQFIVITQDGPDPIVPGSEDDNSYDLGLLERIDPVEFDDRVEINDPVNPTEFTLRDKNYQIETIDRGEDGKIKAVQAVSENGNLRTIRDKSVLNRFDRLMSESQMERQEPTSIPLDDLPSAVRFQAMRQSTNLGEMPESLTLDQAREIVQSLPVAQQTTATRELDAALGRFNVAVAPESEALIPRSSFEPTMDVDFNEVATDPDSIVLDLMSEDTFIDKEGNEFPQAANAFVDGDPGLNTLSLAITDIMAKGRMSPELALTGQGVHIFDDGVSNRLDGINGVFDTDTNQIAVSRSLIEAATSDPDAATTLRIGIAHEIGHRTDLMRSITDGDEGFSFTINEITPSSKDVEFGPILGELYQSFAAENELGRMMAYPFAALNGRLDALTPADLKDGGADRVLNTQRKEAFAQAFSVFFTNPSLLQRHAPKTYAFLDNLNNNPLEGIVDEAQNRFEVRRSERSNVPSEIRTPPVTGGVEVQDTGGDRPTRGMGVEEGQTGADLGEQGQEVDGVSERPVLPDEIEDTPPLPEVEEINDVDIDDVDIDIVDAGEPTFKKLGKPSPGNPPVTQVRFDDGDAFNVVRLQNMDGNSFSWFFEDEDAVGIDDDAANPYRIYGIGDTLKEAMATVKLLKEAGMITSPESPQRTLIQQMKEKNEQKRGRVEKNDIDVFDALIKREGTPDVVMEKQTPNGQLRLIQNPGGRGFRVENEDRNGLVEKRFRSMAAAKKHFDKFPEAQPVETERPSTREAEKPNLKADLNKFLEGREEDQPPAAEPSPTPTRTEDLDRYLEKLIDRGMDPERARQKAIIQVERDEVRKSYIEEGMDPKEAVRLSKEEVPDVDEPEAPKSNVTQMGDDELYMPSLRMSELEDQKLARSAGDVSTVERISRDIQDLVNPKDRTRRDVVSDISQRVVQGVFDDVNRIGYLEKKMNDGELLDGNQSAYKAALWSKNIDTVMQAAFVGGPIEKKDGGFQMVTGEKGFYDIFSNYDKSELRQWELWAAANRADRLIKEGRERLFTQSEIDEIKAEAVATGQEEKFKNTLADWIKFNRKILDLGEATGVIDPESRKRWDKDDYVPFYRFEDEQDVNDGDSDISIAASGIANQSLKIRKLVGGEGKINPLEAMQSLMTQIVAKSFKNEAMQRTVAVLDGTDALMEVADSKSIQELSRDKNSDIIKVSYTGKQKYFVVRDPVLLRSVKGLGVEALDRIGKLVSLPKTVLTRGVTISPAFMMRNAIRDVMAATLQFPNSPGFIDGFKQAIGYVSRGIKAELPGGEINTEDQTDLLQIMASGGLAIGDFYGTGKAKDIRKDLNRINALDTTLKDQAALDSFYDNYLDLGADKAKNLWNKWNRVGQAFEQASRVNIYRNALKNGETHAEAISQAADVLNFSKSGGWSVIRRMVESYPFFNARLQGLNVMGRSIRDNREYVLRKGGELAAMSIALYMINSDNEEYEQLPDYDKDMYFHIFTNDEHFRIPKPFELGFLFGTLPERMATFWREDKDMKYFMDTFHDGLYQALSFDALPQVIQPVVDAYGNQDRFREMPIVSRALENAPAREQYTIFTNDTAKWIAQNMPDAAPEMLKSPAKMDFLLRGYFASFNWMASYVLDEMIYDNEFGDRPAQTTAQWPLVGSFYRTEAQNTKYGTLFYELRNEMNEIRRQYKSLIDTGKTEAARDLLEDNDGFESVRAGIANYYKRIKALNTKRDLIYKDRALSADAKRDQIQKIYIERNRLYKEAFDKYGAAM